MANMTTEQEALVRSFELLIQRIGAGAGATSAPTQPQPAAAAAPAPEAMSDARRRELLETTALGQAVLSEKTAKPARPSPSPSATYAHVPEHHAPTPAGEMMSPARRQQLLAGSGIGQAIIQSEREAALREKSLTQELDALRSQRRGT